MCRCDNTNLKLNQVLVWANTTYFWHNYEMITFYPRLLIMFQTYLLLMLIPDCLSNDERPNYDGTRNSRLWWHPLCMTFVSHQWQICYLLQPFPIANIGVIQRHMSESLCWQPKLYYDTYYIIAKIVLIISWWHVCQQSWMCTYVVLEYYSWVARIALEDDSFHTWLTTHMVWVISKFVSIWKFFWIVLF